MLFVSSSSTKFILLLISIFLTDSSSSAPDLKVEWLIKAPGEDVEIKCATNKTDQEGVTMFMSTNGESTFQEIFYKYKTHDTKLKADKNKFSVTGEFPQLLVTFSNVTAADTGFYWCEFNYEEKKTPTIVTFLTIESKNEPKQQRNDEEPGINVECPEFPIPNVMILCFCASVFLLFIIGSICVVLKMKGNRKYKPTTPNSDSVYEEMRRSNSNAKPTERSFINPDYQSTKELG